MVVYSYQARQQKRGLTPHQRRMLNKALLEKAKSTASRGKGNSTRFIEKIDKDVQVLWRKGDDGNPVVLSIVTRNDAVEHITF
ncbi:hypothetical protein D3C87_1868760 [compost metagenome]|jgi:hypothetical protein